MYPTRTHSCLPVLVLAAALWACGEPKQAAAPPETTPTAVAEPEAPAEPEPAAEAPAAAPAEPAAPEAAAAAQPATVDLEIYKAGFIVGVSGGRGTLHFEGRSHSLKIAGVSLGATAGLSKAELVGEVRNLHRLADIEGTYSATQAGIALGGGAKITRLENSKGVSLEVRGKQIGFEIALDLNGMQISLAN